MMSIAEDEDKLNEKLKAAGLWEDGLSFDEKQTLCNLLVESCTSAQNEEEQRRQLQLNEEKKDPPSQNADESHSQDDQPQHVIQESATADAHQEIEEIGSSEEIMVASASQSSQCKETAAAAPPQQHATDHAPFNNDLLQLPDDGSASESLIASSCDIDASSSVPRTRSRSPIASSTQKGEKYSLEAGSMTLQSVPSDETAKGGMNVGESTVKSSQSFDDDPSDHEASQSLLGDEKKGCESETSFHCNLVLEQSKLSTVGEEDLDEHQAEHQSENNPTSTVNINDEKPANALQSSNSSSGCKNENDSKSKRPVLDMSDRMPERHIIELHSKRLHDIKFNSPTEFMSASEETRVKIYKEILESLAKVSLALASSRRKPHVAMPWKKVIKQLPPKTAEDKTMSSCGSYSLRQRRGLKNRREIISDVYEEEMEELPEVEQIVKGKDDDWLPSLRSKKRRKSDATGQQSVPNSEIAQIEYQSSDDEAFVSLTGKRKLQRRPQKVSVVNGSVLPRLKDDQSSSQHTLSAALPHLNIDKAFLASSGKKYGSVVQEKTLKHDSVIKMTYTQPEREDSSSDVDVLEVDEPASKFPATIQSSLKSNLTSTTSSKQQPLNNRIPVLSGTSLSSPNNSTPLPRNDSNLDTDKQRCSVVRNLLNSSSPFFRDQLKNSSLSGAEQRPSSPPDEDVTIRPAPVKLRGEKRALIAGSASPAPKIPCKSKIGSPTTRCSRDQSPSAQTRLPHRSEGQLHPSLEDLSDRHNMILELAERRRILEESKRAGRGPKPKPTPDEGPANFQCPLCQVFFTRARIESHAAECDGVSPISTRQQRRPQLDHQKPSCSSGPARPSKCQQPVVHSVTTIDSESEDQDSDRVLMRAGLRGNNSSVTAPLAAYSTAVHTRGAGGSRPPSANAAKGYVEARQQLLLDSDDDEVDLVPLDGAGKSSSKSTHNNGLKRNK
ncbi:hypothetical protein FHG87_005483 [Trinorchestia longiramus]|nr:hypothetical protein FHG87_005483 [Trinorchestia longiramus]